MPATLVVDSLLDTALADIPAQPVGVPGGSVIIRATATSSFVEDADVVPLPLPLPVPSLEYLTLRAAIELSERFDFMGPDTITFSNGILVQGQQVKIDLTSQLLKFNESESLTVIGPGADKLAINGSTPGGAQCRILMYGGSSGMEMSGLTFLNGRSPTTGGAIQIGARSVVVPLNNGNPIRSFTAGLKLTDCVFSGNHALNGAGGAIYNADTPLFIKNTKFIKNEATETGGAIATGGSAGLLVEGTANAPAVFEENKGSKGGAIAAMGNDIPIVLKYVNFTKNTASVEGGALYLSGGGNNCSLSVSWAKFTENEAFGLGGKGLGGAVQLSTWDASSFGDCEFKDNKASHEGGAVFVKNKSLAFSSCTFLGNTATIGNVVSYVGNFNAQIGGLNWLRISDVNCTGFELTQGVG